MSNDDIFTRPPKVRDMKKMISHEIYAIGDIPKDVIKKIGKQIVYQLCVGMTDLSGNEWGNIFAKAVGGQHLQSPVGIADVVMGENQIAWSMKTVKSTNPFNQNANIRLISGRCSPDYSYGIENPHDDIEKTGRAVLEIWNERINIAYDYYNPVRTNILVRNEDLSSFAIWEEENHRYIANDYRWEENKRGNLIGIEKVTGTVCFTWQPHGSQFTIHTKIPSNAVKFRVKCPPKLDPDKTLEQIHYDDSWIEILRNG